MKKLVLGVPQAKNEDRLHPGGQLTAANSLVEVLRKKNIEFHILNTAATVYPLVPLWRKIFQSIYRVYKSILLAKKKEVEAYIAFSGFGLSLYERCLISYIFRFFGKQSIIFFRNSELLMEQSLAITHRKILSIILSSPSVVVTQGSILAKELKRIGVVNCEIIPNWLPVGYKVTEKPKSYPIDGVVHFVFIGWLEPSKGLKVLLNAILNLQSMKKDFCLHVVGKGSLNEYASYFIKKNNLNNVLLHGWLDPMEVVNILQKSHIFILPSHNEGFPNALLEAMAHGMPAIITPVGGVPDSIIHDINGIHIKINDVSSLACAMIRYIKQTNLIREHSINTILIVKKRHGQDINCTKLINLLEENK